MTPAPASPVDTAHQRREDHRLAGRRPLAFALALAVGRGGIREIEFFTQTRQLIAGRRDPTLRSRTTREGLARNLTPEAWDRMRDMLRSDAEQRKIQRAARRAKKQERR